MSTDATLWAALVIASLGCFVLKWAGLSLPERLVSHPRVQHVGRLIPITLLAALVAVQSFTASTGALTLDARAGGLLFAVVALTLRAPFLVVVFGAALVAALLRLV